MFPVSRRCAAIRRFRLPGNGDAGDHGEGATGRSTQYGAGTRRGGGRTRVPRTHGAGCYDNDPVLWESRARGVQGVLLQAKFTLKPTNIPQLQSGRKQEIPGAI